MNEYTTELQINSNNSSIDYFRNKIEHYKATGDKNNLAAAEDTLKNIQRKPARLYIEFYLQILNPH